MRVRRDGHCIFSVPQGNKRIERTSEGINSFLTLSYRNCRHLCLPKTKEYCRSLGVYTLVCIHRIGGVFPGGKRSLEMDQGPTRRSVPRDGSCRLRS